ncbi:nucleotidyl transferase AbiEii/AbiGii toxin family protein [Eubacteriales bacterium DFI.9.88]|nr:nucleotidyl transferase AbiEii/AbiGii toxin family protein [Eubacteriales bacterium DFI.9.88]
MRLHENKDEFRELAVLTSKDIGIPEAAIIKDYHIVQILENLANSIYADQCIFKGGTSLSKCYPGIIERFSEDIDLTFTPHRELSNKQYDKQLKALEQILTTSYSFEKIAEERNSRNKSSYVFLDERRADRIKLEIGSSVRPEPYSRKTIKTYIQEFLEKEEQYGALTEYRLKSVPIYALDIERTFVDKLFAVKRHALCNGLVKKVRHIYDVNRLLEAPEIRKLINDSRELKRIVRLTKETDAFYLQKRNLPEAYDPVAAYDFDSWSHCFDSTVKKQYEQLHRSLLYTDDLQDFEEAKKAFAFIGKTLQEIGE